MADNGKCYNVTGFFTVEIHTVQVLNPFLVDQSSNSLEESPWVLSADL